MAGKTEKLNIICDIAGNYQTFLALVAKMPKDHRVLALGDLIDRGPRSREVIEWFMKNRETAVALRGNHEQLMLDSLRPSSIDYGPIWFEQGGRQTLMSFINAAGLPEVPEGVLDWIAGLPHFHQSPGLLVTHAPLVEDIKTPIVDQDLSDEQRSAIIWNRGAPVPRPGLFQVYGHNGRRTGGVKWHEEGGGPFAVCIDTSTHGKLTGLTWPQLEIYQQEIIDV